MRSRPVRAAISSMVHSRWSTSNRREDGEAPRERPHGKRIGLSRAILCRPPSTVRIVSCVAAAGPFAMGPPAATAGSTILALLSDNIRIVCTRCKSLTHRLRRKCYSGIRIRTWEPVGGRRMSEQVFTNLTNSGPVSVYVKDGSRDADPSAGRRRRVRDQALGDRGGRQEVLAAEEVQPRADGPRRARAPLLRRAHQVPDEAGGLRPQRASATRRTAASRPTSASRGTRRSTWSRAR